MNGKKARLFSCSCKVSVSFHVADCPQIKWKQTTPNTIAFIWRWCWKSFDTAVREKASDCRHLRCCSKRSKAIEPSAKWCKGRLVYLCRRLQYRWRNKCIWLYVCSSLSYKLPIKCIHTHGKSTTLDYQGFVGQCDSQQTSCTRIRSNLSKQTKH